MRIAARTMLAFILSILGGHAVVEVLAQWMLGREEYVTLFVLPVLVAVVVTFIFLLARLANDPPAVVALLAKGLLALLLIGFVALMLLMLIDGGPETLRSDGDILVGLFLPAAIVVLIQWWMFGGGRREPRPLRFGRGAA